MPEKKQPPQDASNPRRRKMIKHLAEACRLALARRRGEV